jgi:hypothetical protein
LVNFNSELEILIETDISDYSIRVYLSQEGKTIVYYSRKITPAELNYNIYNKELLAIVETATQ